MRPRPEGRGELAPQLRGLESCSFNAATTRRPWRTASSRQTTTNAFDCFNAATTRRPWRTFGDVTSQVAAEASMRPRPEGRGERHSGIDAHNGASFNAATTRRPWRTSGGPCGCVQGALQCGHDPKAVENREACVGDRVHCFNAATTRRPWRTRARSGRRRSGLQCGHDPKAVENHVLCRPMSAEARLQCGHDPKAVENSRCRGM